MRCLVRRPCVAPAARLSGGTDKARLFRYNVRQPNVIQQFSRAFDALQFHL